MADHKTPTDTVEPERNAMGDFKITNRPARTALHEDKEASAYVLQTPTASLPLKIGASNIASPGSGLFSENKIDAGRQIFSSKPLIACVDTRVVSVCHYCLEDSTTGIPSQRRRKAQPSACSGCKLARFCSKECQTKAWKIFHKDECKVLGQFPDISSTHLALYRILFWQDRKHLPTKVGKVLSLLEDHFPDHAEVDSIDDLYKAAQSIRATAKSNVALHVLWKLLLAIQSNVAKIRFADTQQTYGEVIDLLTCAINHSCDPNAVLFVEKGQVVARSLRVINPGVEITICYSDSMAPVVSRRSALEKTHFFYCWCKRCESEAKEERELAAKGKGTLKVLHQAQENMKRKCDAVIRAAHNTGVRKQYEDAEKMEREMHSLTKQALPAIEWPEHLNPLPKTRTVIAWLYEKQGLLLPAVHQALSATLMGRYRSGPDWVNLLCDLTQFMGQIAAEAPDAPVFQVPKFPMLWHFHTVVRGYGLVLAKDAACVYGGQTGFTLDVCDWFAMMNGAARPMPGTPQFKPAFEEAQKQLLAWADIDEKFGIVLPF